MRSLYTALFLIFASLALAQSNNMTLMSATDGIDGDYNDIWGYVHNGTEYAIIGSATKVTIFDVSDCANPVQHYQVTGLSITTWRDCKDYGDYVYCVDDKSGGETMLIYDKVNNNHSFHSVGTGLFSSAHNIFIDTLHGRLYVVGSNLGEHHIGVYDLNASPTNPSLLKDINLKNLVGDNSEDSYYIHDIYVRDHIAYGSHGYTGLKIWDFSDVNNIQLLGSYNDNIGYNHSSWMHETEDILYMAFELPAGVPMYIMDVSDPSNIQKLGEFKDPLLAPAHEGIRPHNPFVKGKYLYISYYHDGVKVYDVEDADNPEFVAYYDTYPSNTDYSSWKGSWGIYPFLPSGCLVVSDIQTGLYTMRLTKEPTDVVRVVNHDIIFEADSTNFLMRDLNENQYRLVYNTTLQKVVPELAPSTQANASICDADLYFEDYQKGPILKQNGQYYRLTASTSGTLEVTSLITPPDGLRMASGQLKMDNYASGFILKDRNGQCYKYHLNDSGSSLEVEEISCP